MLTMPTFPGRTIVITGATGYVGRHLASELALAGQAVAILGRANTSKVALDNIGLSHLPVLQHDDDASSIAKSLSKLPRPIIIHLAAHFVSNHSDTDLDALIAANLTFPTFLFDAMRQADCRDIVNIGTIWQHDEIGSYSPANLYAAMKHAAQCILDYYVIAHDFRPITLKLLDTYGRNDERKKLMPLLKAKASSGDAMQMTEGKQLINLCYIDDVLRAVMLAAQRIDSNTVQKHERYLVLGSETLTVRDLVERICEQTSARINVQWGAIPANSQNQHTPWLTGPKLPGWEPLVGLNTGLRDYFGDRI